MTDRIWLQEYSGQTADELLSMADRYRIDSLVLAFEQALDQKAARLGEDALTDEERVVLAIEGLEREVNNGGYRQFFLNCPEHVPIIVQALERIRHDDGASLTRAAVHLLGVPAPLAPESVIAAAEGLTGKRLELLGECDEAYHAGVGDLAEPLLEFIRQHRSSITLHEAE